MLFKCWVHDCGFSPWYTVFHTQYVAYSIRCTQYSVVIAKYSVLHSQYSVLSTLYSVLNASSVCLSDCLSVLSLFFLSCPHLSYPVLSCPVCLTLSVLSGLVCLSLSGLVCRVLLRQLEPHRSCWLGNCFINES